MQINWRGIKSIYIHEMHRFLGSIVQSLASPIITTVLYFVVFGSAIGSQIETINGIKYSFFILPGLTMLSILSQSLSNASFGIYMQKHTGSIYEILSAPISIYEVLIGFISAAASKSVLIGIIIMLTATLFVDITVAHPFWMVTFFILTCVSFSMFGFIIGLWANNFDQISIIPLLVVTPLVFLGGSFYSIDMLPEFWRNISLFNPLLYLISGFRWSFYEVSDVSVTVSFFTIFAFLAISVIAINLIFKRNKGFKI